MYTTEISSHDRHIWEWMNERDSVWNLVLVSDPKFTLVQTTFNITLWTKTCTILYFFTYTRRCWFSSRLCDLTLKWGLLLNEARIFTFTCTSAKFIDGSFSNILIKCSSTTKNWRQGREGLETFSLHKALEPTQTMFSSHRHSKIPATRMYVHVDKSATPTAGIPNLRPSAWDMGGRLQMWLVWPGSFLVEIDYHQLW